MKRAGRTIPGFDSLESRTCPSASLAGDYLAVPQTAAAFVGTVAPEAMSEADHPDAMFDWIMMAMILDDMKMMYNEFDQMPEVPGLFGQPSEGASSGLSSGDSKSMTSGAAGASTDVMMSSDAAMPPAQMASMPEPMEYRASSMPRSVANISMEDEAPADASKRSEAASPAKMSGSMPGEDRKNGPPRLSPGELEPAVAPALEAAPLEPFLESVIEPMPEPAMPASG